MRINHIFSTLLLLVNLVNYGCERSETPVHDKAKHDQAIDIELDADVIIIGAGISGLSAALELVRRERSVILVDMASVFGGHAVMSGGGLSIINTPYQHEHGVQDPPELAFQDFVAWGEDVNEEWVKYYVHHSKQDIYDFVTETGVRFVSLVKPPGNSQKRMHFPAGAGVGLVSPIYQAILPYNNIRFLWNTRADALIFENDRVTGVKVSNIRSGTNHNIHARAVLIATGGFQSNIEMVKANWRKDWQVPERILAGSGWNSQGSGLKLAGDVGAIIERLDHQWNYVFGIPDPRYPDSNRGLNFFITPGITRPEIWLNNEGLRFVNECLSSKFTLPEIIKQPGQNYWVIFDARGKQYFGVSGAGWTPEKVEQEIFANPALVKTARSLSELSEKIQVPESAMLASIQRFNELIEQGTDTDFGRFGTDIAPPFCINNDKIETAPFYAIKRYPLARKSMGGIRIDINSQAINQTGKPIPGLYAAGEANGLAGINGKAGLEGTFLGPSIVTGRVAARSIAGTLADIPVTPLTVNTQMTAGNDVSAEIPDNKPSCKTCHDIDSLITMQRSGYQHFEVVHREVRQRDMDCQLCHSEMYPYNPAAHKIDALNQSFTCSHCHAAGD